MGCGHVITDHTVDMGAEKRNFEGEEVLYVFEITQTVLILFIKGPKSLWCCTKQAYA